jgi:hypothetical protein
MKQVVAAFALLASQAANADGGVEWATTALQPGVVEERDFQREYALGIGRETLDGGRIYGWRLHDRVTFGRFQGENDAFGFSFDVGPRQRIEVTSDGVRWRRTLGGR